jgi:hypothetical protein
MSVVRRCQSGLAALGAAALMAGLIVAPVAAENPCVEGVPTSIHHVRGVTWVGTVLSVDTSLPLQPAYDISVEHVYAGSDQLQAGDVVHLLSYVCMRVVGLEAGAEYLISTGIVPEGLVGSDGIAAWKLMCRGSTTATRLLTRRAGSARLEAAGTRGRTKPAGARSVMRARRHQLGGSAALRDGSVASGCAPGAHPSAPAG